MADECADITNEEQLVICFRWVNENLEVHEDFAGLHPLCDTKADATVKVIFDTIQKMGLKIKNARRQCYDGASTMAGVKNGVAAKIKLMNEAALYTYCYGHALNLAVNDCIRNTKDLNDVWVMLKEICNLVKKSPSRESKIREIREKTKNHNKGIRVFCPTHWTIHGETCAPVFNSHEELMESWEWSLSVVNHSEMKARIIGAKNFMKMFRFLFGCKLGYTLLQQTDNLSKALQEKSTSACQGM